jgi:hypothetical protein
MATNIAETIKSLQTWKDFSPNLFEATAVLTPNENTTAGGGMYTDGNIVLSVTALSFETGSLEAERHPLLRKFVVKNYQWENTVSITWKEDSNLTVWKYHKDWLNNFYNKTNDTYKTTSNGKKKNVTIVIQKNDGTLATLGTLSFIGMIPSSPIELALGWEMSSETASTRQISYNYDYWSYSP